MGSSKKHKEKDRDRDGEEKHREHKKHRHKDRERDKERDGNRDKEKRKRSRSRERSSRGEKESRKGDKSTGEPRVKKEKLDPGYEQTTGEYFHNLYLYLSELQVRLLVVVELKMVFVYAC